MASQAACFVSGSMPPTTGGPHTDKFKSLTLCCPLGGEMSRSRNSEQAPPQLPAPFFNINNPDQPFQVGILQFGSLSVIITRYSITVSFPPAHLPIDPASTVVFAKSPSTPLQQHNMAARDNTDTARSNPVWGAVDSYALPHSHPASRPNTKALADALAASREAGLPEISVSAAQGKFLALHCRAAGVSHALEVGTLGGYSAIWLASENPGLHLTTVEYNAVHVEVARRNIEAAGLSDRVDVVHGAGVDVLARLRDEVRAGTRPPFGFVFIDADKVNNWEYFQLAKQMVKPNSVICVDNVVRKGKLADLGNNEPVILASRLLVENVGKEPGVDSVVLQTVGEKSYDGWLWAVVS